MVFLFLVLAAAATGSTTSGYGAEVDQSSFVAGRVVVFSPAQVELPTGVFDGDGRPTTGRPSLDRLIRQLGATRIAPFYPGLMKRPRLAELASRLRILFLEPGRDARDAARILGNHPDLVSAGLQTLPNLYYSPNDPFFPDQWHLPRIQAPEAWDFIRFPQTRQAVVAIIDTGLQLEHAEIQDNLWVNELEDLNGNERLDPGDINGVDDDGNGFVDDVVGWDFASNDNDPSEIHPHGTGSAACVSAVTDNGTLGAAVGFGVRLMAVKAINDFGQLTDGYVAMLYAADNGARVINCSWGIPVYQEFEQAIVEAVWNEDVVIVAAGGEGETPTYPAAYEHVVAVAATDQNDQVTPFSPFGEYIDICAPGVNILTVWGDDFSYLSGTSFSAGIVAGTIGLYRAQHPHLDNAAVTALMEQTADPIDHLNPGFAGLLGAGRINALAGVVSGLAVDTGAVIGEDGLTCRPNPFNARVDIGFRLDRPGPVSLAIYDTRGRQVAAWTGGIRPAGAHEVAWEADAAASGTYLVVLTTQGRRLVRKLSLVK